MRAVQWYSTVSRRRGFYCRAYDRCTDILVIFFSTNVCALTAGQPVGGNAARLCPVLVAVFRSRSVFSTSTADTELECVRRCLEYAGVVVTGSAVVIFSMRLAMFYKRSFYISITFLIVTPHHGRRVLP